jgi:uncharacterized protein YktB (UPF0637 family)
MATLGCTRDDFGVFRIEDFSARMNEIYARIRPRLLRLGAQLAPELGRKLHLEFFPHVARHARRTVNPPPETWTAFGPSPRGYKRYGYLALCVSGAGLHARAVVKSEANGRLQMADEIVARAGDLQKSWRGTRIGRYDDWDFATLPQEVPANTELVTTLSASLRKRTGGIDLGFGWPPPQASRLDRAELLDAFRELEPLYRILRSVR